GEARTQEPEDDPSSARRDDEAAQPGHERPEQAPGALRGEVERQAEAEEAVGRPDDAQVRRADSQNLGLGAEETEPLRREERGGQPDRLRDARRQRRAGPGDAAGARA